MGPQFWHLTRLFPATSNQISKTIVYIFVKNSSRRNVIRSHITSYYGEIIMLRVRVNTPLKRKVKAMWQGISRIYSQIFLA